MIRGIDGQIMINKSVDYAKQMADQKNNVQQGQDFINEMEKARMSQKDKSVSQAEHAENGRIRREKDEKGNQEREQAEQEEAADYAESGEPEGISGAETGLGASVDINV